MAALAVALLAGLAVLLALAAATVTAPVLLVRMAQRRRLPVPSLAAVQRALRPWRIRARQRTSPGAADALLERARQLG